MKIILTILCTFFFLSAGFCAVPVSIEDFKKNKDIDERGKIIEQAPLEQQEELKRIHLHLMRLSEFGGEEGLKKARESQAANARGLENLEHLFTLHRSLWDAYGGTVSDAGKKAGLPVKKQIEIEEAMDAKIATVQRRIGVAHSLVVNTAATPAALELDKKAKDLLLRIFNRTNWDGVSPRVPVTKSERVAFDREVDQIFEQLKQLPKLTPQQAQAEFDAFTEDKVQPLHQ